MIIKIKSIFLYNFGSYSKAEFNFENRGFCLVSGKNFYKADNSISNGSGKTMLFEAIIYALTGTTAKGISSNLKNINIQEDTCYVSLSLKIDSDDYTITRYHKPKSNLIIIKNNINISGKTFRETEKILADCLPDITYDLLSTTIILSQGLPNKFSSFSPNGRKDLLEKLTKSDFMIENIKSKITTRLTELAQEEKILNDNLLINNTTISNLNVEKNKLLNLFNRPKIDYIKNINTLEDEIKVFTDNITMLTAVITKLDSDLTTNATKLSTINNKKYVELEELNTAYTAATAEYYLKKAELSTNINKLNSDITKLSAISEYCPTCHQKLPNVFKPDTSEQKKQLLEEQKKLAEVNNNLVSLDNKLVVYKNLLNEKYSTNIKEVETLLESLSVEKLNKNKILLDTTTALADKKSDLARILAEKTFYETQLLTLEDDLSAINNKIDTINSENLKIISNKALINSRQQIVKKMETFAKKEFRSYLLSDIIVYLNTKIKQYSKIVFGTEELDLVLDGAALNILYCNKVFDNLSGGEKQRCDLILQFAIRDLLQNYLNYSSNILVLDEIFDNLDCKATAKIVDLILTELKDIESVFIISHHSDELELPVDSEVIITKNENSISEIK